MVQVVLHEPKIPPNTGNIIRLCANTGSPLHLIRPLGFELDDRSLRRAGMDYRDLIGVKVHDSLDELLATTDFGNLFGVSTKGGTSYVQHQYQANDLLLFGSETEGLPESIRRDIGADMTIRIPMKETSRSLNLANAVAIVVYEAWRQQGFKGGQ